MVTRRTRPHSVPETKDPLPLLVPSSTCYDKKRVQTVVRTQDDREFTEHSRSSTTSIQPVEAVGSWTIPVFSTKRFQKRVGVRLYYPGMTSKKDGGPRRRKTGYEKPSVAVRSPPSRRAALKHEQSPHNLFGRGDGRCTQTERVRMGARDHLRILRRESRVEVGSGKVVTLGKVRGLI